MSEAGFADAAPSALMVKSSGVPRAPIQRRVKAELYQSVACTVVDKTRLPSVMIPSLTARSHVL